MYSEALRDHFERPRNAGKLPDAELVGKDGTPGQGNYMVLHVKVRDDRVEEARFQTYGCPAAIASGSWVTQWILGKTLGEAAALEAGAVIHGLGGLPVGREHCAHLAVNALRDALTQHDVVADEES